ncbi:MAG: transposase [Acidobacteriaceae bacterium]
MGFIEGQGRNQGTLFPVALDDLVPADHVCRVIDAFVDGLKMVDLGFERAEAAQTGRPGYDPRDLLKLYLYGYLNQIRSSRRLEAECRRNVESNRQTGLVLCRFGLRPVWMSALALKSTFAMQL